MPRDCAVNGDHLQTGSEGKIGSLGAKNIDIDYTVGYTYP
jgi:hypothetical protein